MRARRGAAATSGRPVVSQCAAALSATSASRGRGAERQDVEGAVLLVGLEEPVEREQAGEQRADPERAGGEAGEPAGLGADAERHEQDDDEEEGEAEAGAAAGAEGEA